MALDEPKTLKQLRAFIGMINFYRDTWGRRAHVLAPLTSLTKVDPKTFRRHWNTEHSKAFRAVKAMIANNVLLHYPIPNLPFDIETDASEYQLGGRILQEGKTVALGSLSFGGLRL